MNTRVAVTPNLEYTGERIVPGKTEEPLFREHEARYVFAGRYVAGKEVLDIACGSGVGTDYLRRAGAMSCYGIDIDTRAIEYAKAAYSRCLFAQGDALHIALPNNSVDVVVSFETIEHISDNRKFLLECKRVLRPSGLLLCSTPNRGLYRWLPKNPYHVREFTAQEFGSLLSEHFGEVALFSQATSIFPLYLARHLTARMLDRLRLKRLARKIIPRRISPDMRHEFSSRNGQAICGICDYKRAWLKWPLYVVAVACNSGGS
jgi:2-polyprenyl-3-methyl-5-hydroxy-6-metoxy-1,4-benzoquinol methylase